MAKRFQFRLEMVERIRRTARDEQRRVVAEKLRRVRGIEEQLAELRDRYEANVESMRTLQRATVLDGAAIRAQQYYRGQLDRMTGAISSELEKAEAELKRERDELAERTKQLKAIEKLHERRRKQYEAEQRRREQIESDEQSVQAYRRGLWNESSQVTA